MALSTLGPYRILERLGAGANGEVCLAEDTRLQRRVALKTLSGTAGSDASELRRRLLREARAAARLNHPHIAAVYDVLETEDGIHIVMEYVRGSTLAAKLRSGPPPPMQVLHVALQLADALAHAHGLGVIHRDLKPANIALTPEGTAKILDFGLARLEAVDLGSTPLSASSELSADVRHTVGTPPYIPPEHLAGAPVDERGDIYSLGVTLFEALTGRRPFEAGPGTTLAQAILSAPTPRAKTLAPTVPAALDAIVHKAMARDPGDRYASAADMLADLRRLSAGIVDAPTQSRPWAPVAAAAGLRRRPVWTAGALIAVGLAVYAALGAGSGGQRPFTGPAGGIASPQPNVVAVLPLAGATGDPQTESLAAGVADLLITALSKVQGLTVVSRAATLKYRDRGADLDEIAGELGANLLVDGKLDRSADRVRVTLTLLQPGSNVVRWQGAYDGTFAEVFGLQREVAEAVAGALRLQVGAASPADDRPTADMDAFAEYAQARSFLERPDVKENLDRSITLFRRAIERDPRFARAHAGLGEAYWRKYQTTRDAQWATEARDALNEALRRKPDDVGVRMSLAAVYRGMGRHADAVEELRTVAQTHPQSDDAHRLLGQALIDLDQVDAGLASIRRAIELRPQYWAHHFGLGSALYSAGRHREAVKAFQRVVDLQPDNAWGYHMLGTTYHALDDVENARRHYETAIRLGNAKAHGNLGILLYDVGRYEEALAHFEASVKLEPRSALKHHNVGDALARLGRRTEALAAYKRAASLCREELAVKPKDAETMATLAVLSIKLGRPADAERHVEAARALDPQSADVLYAAAVVHVLAGRNDRAMTALENALKAGYSAVRAGRDPDLAALRAHSRYAAAIGGAKTEGGT